MKGKVAGIILAAGKSKRLGIPKMLLPLGSGTVIEETVQNAVGSKLDEVLVVVGCRAKEVAGALRGAPVRLVLNRSYEQGMSMSIIAGINSVSPGTASVMVIPSDQPLISSATVNLLLYAFYRGNHGIVVPVCRGQRGHPAIFSLAYRDEILELKGEGLRSLLTGHPDEVLEVEVATEDVISDIDTISDYFTVRGRYLSRKAPV